MPKFSTAVGGVIVLQPGYDAYTNAGGTTLATADGDLVAALKGGGLDLQATSTNRPTFKTGMGPSISGVASPVLRFDGTNDYLFDSAASVGPDFAVLMVATWKSRKKADMVIAGLRTNYNVYAYNVTAHHSFYDGVSVKDAAATNVWQAVGPTDFYALQGVTKVGTALRVVRDDHQGTGTCAEITAGTGLSLGATNTGTLPAQIDVALWLLVPTAGLSAANLTTIAGEVGTYFDGAPKQVVSADILIVVEGNSLIAAGINATTEAQEWQRIVASAITGASVDLRSIGIAGSTTTILEQRAGYLDAYPESVGKTRANSLLIIGEGTNGPGQSTAHIAYINTLAASWGQVVVFLPTVTSGWGQGDAAVTTFYNAVKAASFPANVQVVDTRVAPLNTYNATYFSDSAHPDDDGHAALATIMQTAVQTAISALSAGEPPPPPPPFVGLAPRSRVRLQGRGDHIRRERIRDTRKGWN